jgi:hypothetical protein
MLENWRLHIFGTCLRPRETEPVQAFGGIALRPSGTGAHAAAETCYVS